MKILSFSLVLVFLISCGQKTSEEDTHSQIETLEMTVDFLEQANTRLFARIEMDIREQGERPTDLAVLEKLKALMAAIQTDTLEEVRAIQKELPVLDNELDYERYQKYLSTYQKEENALNYFQLLFHREKMKNDVLNLVGQMFGSRNFFGLGVGIHTAEVGDSSMVLFNPELLATTEGIKIFYSEIEVLQEEQKIPHSYQPIGNSGLIKFPSQAGNIYEISVAISGKNKLTTDSLVQFGEKKWTYSR